MDPKLAWGPEVFPGGGEGRGLASPLRQKQALEDDDGAKGPRYRYTSWSEIKFESVCMYATNTQPAN